MNIRKAEIKDASRIAEIYVFNNRINFHPIFKDNEYSFGELQVVTMVNEYFGKEDILSTMYVYDDGLIKGFLQIQNTELCKLYIEPFFQKEGIGKQFIEFAINTCHVDHLWALEKNTRAIAFYKRAGFYLSGEKKFEEGTTEYLVELIKKIIINRGKKS